MHQSVDSCCASWILDSKPCQILPLIRCLGPTPYVPWTPNLQLFTLDRKLQTIDRYTSLCAQMGLTAVSMAATKYTQVVPRLNLSSIIGQFI